MSESKTQNREVVIRHGVFWYHVMEPQVINGEEKDVLTQRMAFRGETVNLTRAVDIERGERHGAFMSEEEIKQLPKAAELPPPPDGEAAGAPNLNELGDDEIVDWLMSTGEFDGQKKPTADEVVAAVGDNPELADRVLEAEETASGGEPRKGITERLEKVATA